MWLWLVVAVACGCGVVVAVTVAVGLACVLVAVAMAVAACGCGCYCVVLVVVAGNSPAIRASAVGMLFCLSPHERLLQCAQEQATATHRDSRSLAGAIVMAVAVRQAMLCQPLTTPQHTTAFLNG